MWKTTFQCCKMVGYGVSYRPLVKKLWCDPSVVTAGATKAPPLFRGTVTPLVCTAGYQSLATLRDMVPYKKYVMQQFISI